VAIQAAGAATPDVGTGTERGEVAERCPKTPAPPFAILRGANQTQERNVAEIMARVNAKGCVELTYNGSALIDSVAPMTPIDAAYLARGMLACAATLSGPNPPKVGDVVTDAHIPIIDGGGLKRSAATGELLLVLPIPSGIELTFVVSREDAIALGRALIDGAQGPPPPALPSGMVH
jgi:hypothetical protein